LGYSAELQGVLVGRFVEGAHCSQFCFLPEYLDDRSRRGARSPAYGHAARYLARLDALAASGASPEPNAPDHDTYRHNLRQAHGRKAGFWSLIDNSTR